MLTRHSHSAPGHHRRNQGGARGAGGTHPGRSRRASSWLGGHTSAPTPGRRVTSCWKKLLQKLLCPRALGSPLLLQPIRAREQIITNRCPANEAPSPHNGPQAETMSPACRWWERRPQSLADGGRGPPPSLPSPQLAAPPTTPPPSSLLFSSPSHPSPSSLPLPLSLLHPKSGQKPGDQSGCN